MPETINILDTALEQEAGLFLRLINELEGDELYNFIRRVAEIKIPSNGAGHTPADEVVHIARNIGNIESALDNFYRI